MKNLFVYLSLGVLISGSSFGQSNRWQQKVKYIMTAEVDTFTNHISGKQSLQYSNQSNDTLHRVFYHLYWNAFQPNSSMDIRSRELGKQMINGRQDWDGRVKDRILHLKENEIGYQKIISLKMNGVSQSYFYHETILEVVLSKPILPKTTVVFDMQFEAQVPLQIRRSGRDNPLTGVRYSMSQWYPKMCEYDYEGWHPTPYIAREFYGVWGDYDVTIRIDKSYKLGASGVLVNANEIGWGYDHAGSALKNINTSMRSWHFVGKNIHDFVWAADPDYKHLVKKIPQGPIIHVIFNDLPGNKYNDSSWQKVADAAVKVLPYIEKKFGRYPYPQYSFIQGGDGGMEYPMATLISSPSLGTVFHEWMHSWYQMMLGSNESLYAWMDEGFTSFADDLVAKYYHGQPSKKEYEDALKANPSNENLKNAINSIPQDHAGAYINYFNLVKSGLEEPMSTHADHYNCNYAYSVDAYSKGEVFMEQLGYLVGDSVRDKILLSYFNEWKYKHPNPTDFIRVAEKVSGLQLDWYKQYWINSTKTIDYAVDSLWEESGEAKIRLKRNGKMPMPIDVRFNFNDGTAEMHHIPLDIMFGHKQRENQADNFVVEKEWKWVDPYFVVSIHRKLNDFVKVEIDPSKRMADIQRINNVLEINW